MKKIILSMTLIIFAVFSRTNAARAQTSCPNLPTNTGSVVLSTTTTAGNYRVWARMKAMDTNNNSFYLKIDNNCAVLVGDSSQISSTNLTWVDYQNGNASTKIDVNLTAGNHVITFVGSEPGVSVDKIIFTKNLSCVPLNFGDNCPAELQTPTPTPTTTATATPTPTPISTPTTALINFSQYIEAENFTLRPPMTKKGDFSALGYEYISPIPGAASTTPLREANINISLPNSGNYYLWARIMGETEASDALYLGFDNSWDRVFPNKTGSYEWVRVENANNSGKYAFGLNAGYHIIQVGHGEINARLDTVFVTNNANTLPNQSAPTPTLKLTPTPTPTLMPTPAPTKTPRCVRFFFRKFCF